MIYEPKMAVGRNVVPSLVELCWTVHLRPSSQWHWVFTLFSPPPAAARGCQGPSLPLASTGPERDQI